MGHYRSNVRDLEFNLFEVLDLEKALATGEFGDLDGESVRQMLDEAARQAEGPLAESFADADRNPPKFDPKAHAVTLPESFKKSLRAWQQGEWFRIGLSENVGGVPAPSMLAWRSVSRPRRPAGRVPMHARPQVRRHSVKHRKRTATALGGADDRAQLGLDHGAHRAGRGVGRWRRSDQGDSAAGRHLASGRVKRFITNGDTDDLFENIAHLARPAESAGPGTKGLSLFLVPKFHFDPETGEPGERNGVYVTGLEHKMGLKASPTCELTFGQHDRPAVGWLVGDAHNGIAQMFKVIEYARMMVGTKAIATLSTGYLNALDYAKTRVQGADLTQMTDKSAPRVTIVHHPDVRRALLTQKAYAEGLRALYLYTAAHQDVVVADIVSGADAEQADRVNDLLLPIVKGVGSERAYQCLTESLQTLGGSGFLQDYPIEQYIRDAKIDSLYEGTTAIQAQDFFFRKIARDQGRALQHVVGQIQRFLDSDAARPELADTRILLATALADLQAMTGAMTGYLLSSQENARELYRLGLESVRFLLAVGDLLIGWLLLHQAEIALNALEGEISDRDRSFYAGKVAVANFFAKNVLPRLTAERKIVEAVDLTVMDLREEAF